MTSLSKLQPYGTRIWVAVALMSASSLGLVCAQEHVKLGGARQAEAKVYFTATHFVIKVSFRGVTTFDDQTNHNLNLRKGRDYGLKTLAILLGSPKSSGTSTYRLHAVGVEIAEVDSTAPRCRLIVKMPRKGVIVHQLKGEKKRGDAAESSSQSSSDFQAVLASDLGTRTQDYRDTIKQLAADWEESRAKIVSRSTSNDAFFLRIAELEERINVTDQKLNEEIRQDNLLLSLEKKQLLSAARTAKTKSLGVLRQCVSQRLNRGEP